MPYHILADVVVFMHLVFVIFVIGGCFLAIRWPKLAWIHIPAACWGVLVEFSGWICPLTPLENWLRIKGGQGVYRTGFVDNYIMPVLYPAGLTHNVQVIFGALVLAINLLGYTVVFVKYRSGQ